MISDRLPVPWDPASAEAWSDNLGLVAVSMFGKDAKGALQKGTHVLLDGSRASMALVKADLSKALAEGPRSWIWSSDLLHLLVVDEVHRKLWVQRWDQPTATEQRELPKAPSDAETLLDDLAAAPPAMGQDIIGHALGAFQRVRGLSGVTERLQVVKLFNALLLGAEQIQRSGRRRASGPTTVRSVLNALPVRTRRILGSEPAQALLGLDVHFVLDYLLTPSREGLTPHPSLLLRHASSQLYQEAHLEFERSPQGDLFPGVNPLQGRPDLTRRDVRFTPAPLARTLLLEGLRALQEMPRRQSALSILDPACGSGVFLLEALREVGCNFGRSLRLTGFDVSDVATTIAEFCVRHAMIELPSTATASFETGDALARDWGTQDLIVMNPPFISWRDMDQSQKDATKTVLGDLAEKRTDYAMAFVWKALAAVRPGGVVATILPSSLMENYAGLAWREAIQEKAHIHLLARFSGYGYFKMSAVEPAFVVLVKKNLPAQPASGTKVLVADEGSEDKALRLLRRGAMDGLTKSIDLYEMAASSLNSRTWLPRNRRALHLRDQLHRTGSTISSLFEPRQGVLTGKNEAFILTANDLRTLVPKGARGLFRPVAGNNTIRDGRLRPDEFIFYPYDANGITIHSEAEVRNRLGDYYTLRLQPLKAELAARPSAPPDHWWGLTRQREWDLVTSPKLVSAYFGQEGSFAWDEEGRYIAVQGHFWTPKVQIGVAVEEDETDRLGANAEVRITLAYLAILNSTLFADVLRAYCPAVGGGQLNLSVRFISDIPLPDLRDQPSDLLDALTAVGRVIHSSGLGDLDLGSVQQLSELCRRAYRLP